jgi:hypothetical protein
MLGAFNEATPDWLSFFMFTFFTDRDGKMQLESLAQSGFDPLSRTCRFMLTEEAHHMFVGETGVGRTIQRTCEAMLEAGIEDPHATDRIRALGVVDLPTIQKKMNLHYSLSLDLFGSEVSTNAANFYNAGSKGRFQETKIDDDHRLTNATYPVMKMVNGQITLSTSRRSPLSTCACATITWRIAPRAWSAGTSSSRRPACNSGSNCPTRRTIAAWASSATFTRRRRASSWTRPPGRVPATSTSPRRATATSSSR